MYGAAEFKDTAVNRLVSHVSWSKLATVGLILSACALGGCGRKGPLDLPPGAALTPSQAQVESGETQTYRSQAAPGSSADETLFAPSGSQSGRQMTAPRGEKKRIFLDPILD